MTLRIGWFSPISAQTGIASYSAQVLEALCADPSGSGVEVVVFHPAFSGPRVKMPCPTIELSKALLDSDFWALFDVAVYHLGNNSKHHEPIYTALRRHPGLVVLHDHVYQHYLAGVSLRNDFIGPSYVTLAQNAHPGSFNVLKSSGVMQADRGNVHFVPWESEWAVRVPLSDRFVDLGLGAIVHSDYARQGLVTRSDSEDVLTLFMPRPDIEDVVPPKVTTGPVRIACCGHIGGTKGLIELVGSFVQAPHLRQAFHVTIAGFGSDAAFLQTLRKTIAEARLNAVFDIKIAPSDTEYHEVMAQCDLFYNLRYPNTEGASLSLMEQLAYGRPVITYRTGSFAEVPDEACYFLDTVGDTQCLTDTLSHIAQNVAEIEAKGRAAQAAVADKTAPAYAAQFLAHVRSHLDTYRQRAALSHMRAEGMLGDATDELPWFLRFLQARREMQDFYAGALYVPDNFADLTSQTKGAFVAANYLNTPVDPPEAEQIGKVLEGLDAVTLHDVLGKLLTIASMGQEHQMLKDTLRTAALPITDPRVWQILSCLPDRVGGLRSLHALGVPVTIESHDALTLSIANEGFRKAVHGYLQNHPTLWSKRIAGTALEVFLNDTAADSIATLPAIPLEMNVIDALQGHDRAVSVIRQGFHDPESIGIWTGNTRATLQLNLPSDQAAGCAEGMLTVLPQSIEAGDTVTLSVEEMSTKRQAAHEVAFDVTQTNPHTWHLDLQGMSGPLTFALEITQLHRPSEDGQTGDTRALGALLQQLVFQRQDRDMDVRT